MNLGDLSTQLLFTTVPIWVEKSATETTTATAFLYNFPIPDKPGQFIPLLLTNHHVVTGGKRGLIELFQKSGDSPDLKNRVRVEIGSDILTKFVDRDLDLAAVAMGPVLNQLETAGKGVFFRSVGPELVPSSEVVSDLAALEEVVFIGYPSGLRDGQSGVPIIRRGITATPVWNDFEGRRGFLIDAGVFPGSSGSPVFILNQGAYAAKNGLIVGSRLHFLGMITDSMVRRDASGMAYLGLGKVLRSDAVQDFVNSVVRTMQGAV